MSGRIQLALNVDDLGESIAFYAKLFGTGPAKVRPGYANFAVAEPPLKLVLLENPGQGGSLSHLGVEVSDTAAVEAERARLAGAGLTPAEQGETTCCYARQDKFWVQGAPTASPGRSTRSWLTARPSTPRATGLSAAAAPASTPGKRPLHRPRAARQACLP